MVLALILLFPQSDRVLRKDFSHATQQKASLFWRCKVQPPGSASQREQRSPTQISLPHKTLLFLSDDPNFRKYSFFHISKQKAALFVDSSPIARFTKQMTIIRTPGLVSPQREHLGISMWNSKIEVNIVQWYATAYFNFRSLNEGPASENSDTTDRVWINW